MKHYKGYWYCSATATNITHTLQAWDIEDAKNKLLEWVFKNEYKSHIDNLFDVRIECLDGYDIVCKMTDEYNPDRQTARLNYNRINDWLQETFSKNVFFEWLDEDLFIIFRCVDANFDKLHLNIAEFVRDVILNSEIANLFAEIILEETKYND